MEIGCEQDTNPQVYSWNGVTLEKVKSYKYLGIWFSTNAKFTRAMEHISDKSKKGMFSLQAALKQLGHPPISIALQLYESMLKPVMCYGSEVWGFNETIHLDRVETRFLKYILCLSLIQPYAGRWENCLYGKSEYSNIML